jgi:hypothetical protein
VCDLTDVTHLEINVCATPAFIPANRGSGLDVLTLTFAEYDYASPTMTIPTVTEFGHVKQLVLRGAYRASYHLAATLALFRRQKHVDSVMLVDFYEVDDDVIEFFNTQCIDFAEPTVFTADSIPTGLGDARLYSLKLF